jgi:glycosyltransferase involved in cell wall biosynthesis
MLHLVQGLGVGGAEALLEHYMRALPESKYEHFVYYFGDEGPIKDRIKALGIHVYSGKKMASLKNPFIFVFKLVFLVKDLIYFIKDRQIQVIQSHLRRPNQLAVVVGKICKIPTFPTVHNSMTFIDKRPYWDPRMYVIRLMDEFIYRIADNVIAVSHEVKKTIERRYSLDAPKVVVLKNGIVFEEDLMGSGLDRANISDQNPIFRIIAVGRLVDIKRHDLIIRAVAELVNKGIDNIKLMIVGDGVEYARLNSLIYELNLEKYVNLLGMRNDVIDLMKTSDVFVLSSRYEGLSIAMIEAMACGLPVIASDAPGIRDFIISGTNGILFPIGNYKELANCIIELYQNEQLRSKLCYGAKRTYYEEYDMKKNIKVLEELCWQKEINNYYYVQ